MIIGVTGGMGAGKSTVSRILREHGCQVLDTDGISREIMQKGSPLLRLLVKDFGIEIINDKGELDRRKLGKIAFADRDKTRRLNDLVQSAVLVKTIEKVSILKMQNRGKPIFLEIPMLFEAGWDRFVNQIWVVTAPKNARTERIIKRGGLSLDEISARMSLQMDEKEKLKRADVVFENLGSVDDLKKSVEKALLKLREF